MMGLYRPRLYNIKSKKALFAYFKKTAGYGDGVYHCAGIVANNTAVLFRLLEEEWKKDIQTHKLEVKKRIISDAKDLLGR
jgi:hypothetical protein